MESKIYATLGYRATILRTAVHSRPLSNPTDRVLITEGQAAEVSAIRADKKLPIWFDGRVTTLQAESIGFEVLWDELSGCYIKTPIATSIPIDVVGTRLRGISKLSIRRQLREWGAEAALDTMLDAIPNARADWDDAQEISTSDPMFTAYKEAVIGMLGITGEQFQKLITL